MKKFLEISSIVCIVLGALAIVVGFVPGMAELYWHEHVDVDAGNWFLSCFGIGAVLMCLFGLFDYLSWNK